jgi:hypothetical protein
MSSKELTTNTSLGDLFGNGGVLSTQTADDLKALDAMTSSSAFLQRMQLYSKGKSGATGTIIEGGHFGIPRSSDDIVDLGTSVDMLVIARKAKAIDMSDTDSIIVSNSPADAEFKRIVDLADNTRDSGCAYGPTYLVYERSTSSFYELFMGNKSGRYASGKINEFLPSIVDGTPSFPTMTLNSEYITKGKWNWFAPKPTAGLTPIDLPNAEALKSEIEKFMKAEGEEGVETVEAPASGRKR